MFIIVIWFFGCSWCKKIGMPEVLLFESNDLVECRNEKSVMFCLLEIGRIAARQGIEPPQLVALEMEIDEEIWAEEQGATLEKASRKEKEEEEEGRGGGGRDEKTLF